MSDPVTKIEIEDVLSSIRRLVSEENQPELHKTRAAPPDESDRLVLTPALRVADAPDAPDFPPQDADPDWPEAADSMPAMDPVVSGDQDEVAADSGAGAIETMILASDPASESDDGPDDAPACDPDGDPDGEDTPWRDPGATLYEAAQSGADTDPARRGAARQANQGGDQSAGTAAGVSPGDTAQDPAKAPDDQDVRGRSDACGPDTGAADRAATLSAKIEALETAIGEIPDQWEPDGEVGDDYAGTPVQTLQWQDHDGDDGGPAAPAAWADAPPGDYSPPADAPVDAEPDEDLFPDDTLLDEESLRELVADIVRQELQGALGERITRNVRKLVRREIHRALTAQDLE
jgi:hypothetical protein